MQTISATYRVTTPMFLGGAEQQAELRLSSFKGVLRFWWRALALQVFQHKVGDVRIREAELFGSTAAGQSKLLMRMKPLGKLEPYDDRLPAGLTYLAGMGLSRPNGNLRRSAIAAGIGFTIQIALRTELSAAEQELLRKALIAVGLFGGLGSRSRHGFGSVALEHLEGIGDQWHVPSQIAELDQQLCFALKSEHGNVQSPEPAFTAFSSNTRIVLLEGNSHQSPLALLEQVGNEMLRFRSYGAVRNGGRKTSLGESPESYSDADKRPRFHADHDAVQDFLQTGERPESAPERVAFGLPHNYFFGSLSDGRDLQIKAEVTPASDHERRGSPLFFHLHTAQDSPPIAVVTFMPARFLPEGEQLEFRDTSKDRRRSISSMRRRQLPVKVPLRADHWEPIHAFLNRLCDSNQRKESFDDVREVTHA